MLYNLMPPQMVKALQYVHEMNQVSDSEKKTPVDYAFFQTMLQELEYYLVSEADNFKGMEQENNEEL